MPGQPGTLYLSRVYFSQLFPFFHFSPHRFSKSPKVFHSGRQSEGFSKVGAGVGRIVCVSVLPGSWVLGRMALVYPFHVPSRTFLPYGSLLPSSSLPPLYHCPSLFPHFCLCLLLLSGREPSISSDTRTDSSTESYPYKHSHHQSVVSHFSSESQGTVIYNVENDSTSQSSRDTGRDLCSGSCLFLHRGCPRKRNWGKSEMFVMQREEGTEHG